MIQRGRKVQAIQEFFLTKNNAIGAGGDVDVDGYVSFKLSPLS